MVIEIVTKMFDTKKEKSYLILYIWQFEYSNNECILLFLWCNTTDQRTSRVDIYWLTPLPYTTIQAYV